MTIPEPKKKPGRKIPQYEFLREKITYLIEMGQFIRKLEKDNPLETYSSAADDKGWWRIIKECVISQYMGTYLHILDAQRRRMNRMKLFFVDLLSSNGLCSIRGRKKSFFPGSALLAAVRNRSPKHFDKLYLCDQNYTNRQILRTRLENLNSVLENQINYEVCDRNKEVNIDSNVIIDEILDKMNQESNGFYNALIVCDNQGLDIKFNTFKKLQEQHSYTDFIINLPIEGLNRQWGSERKKGSQDNDFTRFCGFPPFEVTSDQITERYIEKLKSIGKEQIELVDVKAGSSSGNFHYFLLIAVRQTRGGSAWMEMVRKLSERFKNLTGDTIKILFDTFFGSQKTITGYTT